MTKLIFNLKLKKVCIFLAWGYALIWTSLQFGTKHGFVLEGFLTTCSFDYFSRDIVTRSLVVSMLIGGYIIPVITLLIFFFLTKRCLEAKTKEMGKEHFVFTSSISKTTKSSFRNATGGDSMRQNSSSRHNSSMKRGNQKRCEQKTVKLEDNRYSYHKRQWRVLRTIIINILFFCIAWTPYAIITVIAQFGPNIDEYITPISTSLPAFFSKTSSVYNPILYTLTNRDCRKFFRKHLGL